MGGTDTIQTQPSSPRPIRYSAGSAQARPSGISQPGGRPLR